MAGFTYNPTLAKSWADTVTAYLGGNGDTEASIGNCLRSFKSQMEALTAPEVWTGEAAKANFDNFQATYNSLVAFANSFGQAFQDAMNKLAQDVGALEVANIGNNTVTQAFGELSFTNMEDLSIENINVDYVHYNYDTIISIGNELASIKSSLLSVSENLSNVLDKIGTDSNIWGGNVAEQSKEDLKASLQKGMDDVSPLLDTCISNITKAGENAQNADSASA